MDDSVIEQKLKEAEQYAEKVKIEFYLAMGKVAALKELLKKGETNAV